ncbi:MAG: MBL fold metallo-hydrolase [Christensenellaceae bacterium]|jgi:phosphoribosyl 1,2-cyclic phosphate phosphodiesterase|nr:MBL fold metallo-hydrolase [Christensenellaceae bacterium]
MKITFLGSGGVTGTPVWNCNCPACVSDNPKNKRFRSSLLVKINDKNVIIDFGPDFSHQLLRNNVRKIDYAFLTHAHTDHCAGYDQFGSAENCVIMMPKDVATEFFGGKDGKGTIKDYLLARSSSLKIEDFAPLIIDGVKIDTVKLQHQKDFAPNPTPCYGYIFRSPNFAFAYCSDYNKILEPEKLKGLDLLISDGSGWENRGTGHVGVKGSIEVFNEIKPKKMIITHISHKVEHDELCEFLKDYPNISAAYDGLVLDCV